MKAVLLTESLRSEEIYEKKQRGEESMDFEVN